MHRYFGIANNIRREHESAVRYFTKACRIDPSFKRARLDRGVLLWRELGQPEAALDDFNALLEEDPHYAPALLNRAMVTQNRGQFQAALADFERYLVISQDSGDQYQGEVQRTVSLLREMIDQ